MTWQTVKLADAALRIGGGTPSRKINEYWDGDIPWFTVADLKDIQDIQRITFSRETITRKGLEKSAAKLVPAGAIVFSSRVVVGKVGIAINELATNQDFSSFVPAPDFNAEFIAYFLLKSKFDLRDKQRGATIKGVTTKTLENLDVPKLSLSEQHRIVSRIKECMKLVDEIEDLRVETIEEAGALMQSVLHDTWQSDEIVSAEKMALGTLGQITTGNTPSRKKPEFFGGSQPWVTPGDFNGRLIATGRECLSKKGIREGRARVVPEGSVLVVCIGATIGKVALAVGDLGINQQINSVAFNKEKVLPEYGYWACRALLPEIIGNASKNTLPILNKGRFSKLEIPVPSMYIQEQVSSMLDAVEAFVSEIWRDLSESNIARTSLRESILRKAFSGKL